MRAIKVYCPPGAEPPLYAFIDALDGKLKAKLLWQIFRLRNLSACELKEPHFKHFSLERYSQMYPPSLNRHAVQVDAQRIIPHPPKGLSSVHGLTGASHRAAMFLLIKHGSPITARHGRKRDRLGFEMSLRQKECFPLSVPTPQEIERMSLKGR